MTDNNQSQEQSDVPNIEDDGGSSGGDWGSSPEKEENVVPVYAPAYLSDRHFYRVVVYSLALVIAVSLIGSIVLVYCGKEIEASIIALGSTAVGALAGVIARGQP